MIAQVLHGGQKVSGIMGELLMDHVGSIWRPVDSERCASVLDQWRLFGRQRLAD